MYRSLYLANLKMKNMHYYTTVPAGSRNPKSPNGINQLKNPL
jgi:hypothetical protein